MELRVDPPWSGGTLQCPWCDFGYVHIGVLDVGARHHGEDSAVSLLRIDATTARVEVRLPGEEISSRRQWITLRFDCEGCEGGQVHLAQHKGQTVVTFDPPRRPEEHQG